MNKRIQELAIEAGAGEWGDSVVPAMMDIEKFAELIVKECANRATWAQDTNAKDVGGEVLKHFGVE